MKSPGQIAYEADCSREPLYGDDGTPRRTWDQLPAFAKESWEKNPTDRGGVVFTSDDVTVILASAYKIADHAQTIGSPNLRRDLLNEAAAIVTLCEGVIGRAKQK